MLASALLPLSRPQGSLFILKSALVTTPELTYLIRVFNDHTALTDVQTGEEDNGQAQLFGKLKAGDVVIQDGTEDVLRVK